MTNSRERAITIRDHALGLVLRHGNREAFESIHIVTWYEEPWRIVYRRPSQRVPDQDLPVLKRRMHKAPLPLLRYALDVWRGAKVLSIEWSDYGWVSVITFKRGAWEDELLSR